MVECYLAKVDVAGPNPVSRSIFLCPFSIETLFGRHLSQEVRQRSAKSPSPVRIRKVPPFSIYLRRSGGIGRRKGLKIPRDNLLYRFEPGLRHHFWNNPSFAVNRKAEKPFPAKKFVKNLFFFKITRFFEHFLRG